MGLVNNGNCKVEPTIALMSEQNISIGRLETEQSQFYMAGYRVSYSVTDYVSCL